MFLQLDQFRRHIRIRYVRTGEESSVCVQRILVLTVAKVPATSWPVSAADLASLKYVGMRRAVFGFSGSCGEESSVCLVRRAVFVW